MIELFYDLSKVNTVDFIPYLSPSSPYSGISITRLRTNNTFKKFWSDSKITFVGYRIPAQDLFVHAQYNETITLQTSDGMLSATTTYPDSGGGFNTTVDKVQYMILNGTGKYKQSTLLTIHFDNTLNRRRIVIT